MRWQDEGMPIKMVLDESGAHTIEPGEYPEELNELFGYDERADFAVLMAIVALVWEQGSLSA